MPIFFYTALRRLDVVGFDTYAYPEGLKQKIFEISESGSVQEICMYNALLGKLFAEAAKRVCLKCGVALESVMVIGSHGYVLLYVILGCFGTVLANKCTRQPDHDLIKQFCKLTFYYEFSRFSDKASCKASNNIYLNSLLPVAHIPCVDKY